MHRLWQVPHQGLKIPWNRCGDIGEGLLCVTVGRGLLCLTVRHRARFAVSSGAWSELCCARQLGMGRNLLCLTVGHRATFAVPDNGAWGKAVPDSGHEARFVVPDSGVWGEVWCAWQWGVCLTVLGHRASLIARYAYRLDNAMGSHCMLTVKARYPLATFRPGHNCGERRGWRLNESSIIMRRRTQEGTRSWMHMHVYVGLHVLLETSYTHIRKVKFN